MEINQIRHNDRYNFVAVTINNGITFYLYDAIIWRQDADNIDIAKYGENLTSVIISIEYITKIDYNPEKNRLRLCLTIPE